MIFWKDKEDHSPCLLRKNELWKLTFKAPFDLNLVFVVIFSNADFFWGTFAKQESSPDFWRNFLKSGWVVCFSLHKWIGLSSDDFFPNADRFGRFATPWVSIQTLFVFIGPRMNVYGQSYQSLAIFLPLLKLSPTKGVLLISHCFCSNFNSVGSKLDHKAICLASYKALKRKETPKNGGFSPFLGTEIG